VARASCDAALQWLAADDRRLGVSEFDSIPVSGLFGVALAAWTIRLALEPIDAGRCAKLAALGSIVILPFWVAALAGWSVGGIEKVWGSPIRPRAATVQFI
jgi:hypothetical protein